MKVSKFFFIFGMLFVVLGAVIGIGSLVGGLMMSRADGPFAEAGPGLAGGSVFFAVVFISVFCGVGGLFAWIGRSLMKRDEDILEKGRLFQAKIYGYQTDGQMTINGMPTQSLVVRYFDDGVMQEAVAPTGGINMEDYPIGGTVDIRVLEGAAALVPGSVRDDYVRGQDQLLDRDFDPKKIVSSVGMECPGCGAALVVPKGMAVLCPYCGRKVSAPAGTLTDAAADSAGLRT